MKVQVHLGRPLHRAPRPRKRPGGPRRPVERAQGSERSMARAASFRERRHRHGSGPTNAGGAHACGNRYHDPEHVDEFGHGRLPAGVVPAAV